MKLSTLLEEEKPRKIWTDETWKDFVYDDKYKWKEVDGAFVKKNIHSLDIITAPNGGIVFEEDLNLTVHYHTLRNRTLKLRTLSVMDLGLKSQPNRYFVPVEKNVKWG